MDNGKQTNKQRRLCPEHFWNGSGTGGSSFRKRKRTGLWLLYKDPFGKMVAFLRQLHLVSSATSQNDNSERHCQLLLENESGAGSISWRKTTSCVPSIRFDDRKRDRAGLLRSSERRNSHAFSVVCRSGLAFRVPDDGNQLEKARRHVGHGKQDNYTIRRKDENDLL